MKKKILFLIMVIGAMSACFSGSAYAASNEKKSPSKGEIERNFFEGCLSSANSFDKYNLYKKCIGKFTNECTNNLEKYEDWLEDITVGPPNRDCIEMESQWWSKLFDKHAKEFRHKMHTIRTEKQIIDASEATLAGLKKRLRNECGYDSVSYGEEGRLQNIDESFICGRNIEAEIAINVYIMNKFADHISISTDNTTAE